MKNIMLILATVLVFSMTSCEKYEDYTGDFEYSTVCFGTQKPLRTLVARNEEMSFRYGVSLGGIYTNDMERSVGYEIDPELLQTVANGAYQLLPESYYTLSDNSGQFTIPAGEIIGDITLTLNRSVFCSDPLALSGGYALPLRLDPVSETIDSVLVGSDIIEPKDYTVIVVKYVSPYSGTYYQQGNQTITAPDSTYQVDYNSNDLSKSQTLDFSTVSVDTVAFTTTTTTKDGVINSTQNFKLCIKEDKSCVLLRDNSKISTGDFSSATGTWEWTDESKHLLRIDLT